MSEKTGIKHLVQCHCVLPQYRTMPDPVFHKFIVFSIQDESGNIEPKIAKCNNCGITHKVTDVCKSEIIKGSENIASVISVEDMSNQISDKIASILISNKCDIPTWENILFVIENEMWNIPVVISKTKVENFTQLKIIRIIGKDDIKIETKLRQDDIIGGFSLA